MKKCGTNLSVLLLCVGLSLQSTAVHGLFLQAAIPQVPVLCYHHVVLDMKGHAPAYSISLANFRAQLQMLSDSGYKVISPDQLYEWSCKGAALPARSVLLTFDDGNVEQATLVAPLLDSFGYKATFFIMTVTIGKPHYLSAEQIRMLAAHGHVIGAHSWDHPDLRTATAKDWPVQMGKPKQQLEEITGKPVLYFAWPYGMWNDESVAALKHYGYKAAFQLTGKPGLAPTSFTIRRLMVSGSWSAATLYNQLLQVFN